MILISMACRLAWAGAIDTYTDGQEEFPDFTAFWFDKKPGDTTFTVTPC